MLAGLGPCMGDMAEGEGLWRRNCPGGGAREYLRMKRNVSVTVTQIICEAWHFVYFTVFIVKTKNLLI